MRNPPLLVLAEQEGRGRNVKSIMGRAYTPLFIILVPYGGAQGDITWLSIGAYSGRR